LKWKDAISGFPVLQGSAEPLDRWGGKRKHRRISYFLSNTSAKNYHNWIVYVKLIWHIKGGTFWDTVYMGCILASSSKCDFTMCVCGSDEPYVKLLWPLVLCKNQLSLTNLRCIMMNVLQTNKVDAQCDRHATELSWQRFASKVTSCQLPHLHLTYPTCIWCLCWGWPVLRKA